jgi:AraC-like DNA-binding protein
MTTTTEKPEQTKRRRSLVENRVSFAGPHCEFSIYDTYYAASNVDLKADQLLYCGMVSGRKIMHSVDKPDGEVFLPHESFVMAPQQLVSIDFPDASNNNPTTCLTVEISKEKVATVADQLNQVSPLLKALGQWEYRPNTLHVMHTTATEHLLNRMVSVFTDDDPDRDVMVDLGISELVIRLLRHQTRDFLLNYGRSQPDANGLTAILAHIENNLASPLDIEQLSKIACMSRSRLYEEFKKHMGCSPGEFQQQLRLKAAADLLSRGIAVTTVSYDLGFTNPSHFSRRFSHFFGCSPKEYARGVKLGAGSISG